MSQNYAGYQQGYPPYQYPQQPTNSIQQYQARLAELERQAAPMRQNVQQSMMQQPMMQQMPIMQQAPAPRSLLVTSIDEARACNVLDGAKYIFVDTSNGQIYTRQFSFDTGKAELEIYQKVAPEGPAMPPVAPEPIDEMQALKGQFAALEAKYDLLEAKINDQHECHCAKPDTAKSAGTDDISTASDNERAGAKPKSDAGSTSKKSTS